MFYASEIEALLAMDLTILNTGLFEADCDILQRYTQNRVERYEV